MSGKGMRCAASGCNNQRKVGGALSFFKLPSDENRCLKWIINTRRKDLEAKYVAMTPVDFFTRNYSVCADHFRQCCFMSSKKNKLVHDAIPSLFTFSVNSDGAILSHRKRERKPRLLIQGDTIGKMDPSLSFFLEESMRLDDFIKQKHEYSTDSTINIFIDHMHGEHKEVFHNSTHITPISSDFTLSLTPRKECHSPYFVCCASNCVSSTKTSVLYPLPTNLQLARYWLQLSGLEHLLPITVEMGSSPSNVMICRSHFTSDQFLPGDQSTNHQMILKPTAIPTLFEGGNDIAKSSPNLSLRTGNQKIEGKTYFVFKSKDSDAFLQTKSQDNDDTKDISKSTDAVKCEFSKRSKKLNYDTSLNWTDEEINLEEQIKKLESDIDLLTQFSNILETKKSDCTASIASLSKYRLFTPLLDVKQAMLYCYKQLNNTAYQFFLCQRINRSYNHWNNEAIVVPMIANRCGVGARSALREMFRLPSTRTLTRHRRVLRSGPKKLVFGRLAEESVRHKRGKRRRSYRSISNVLKRFLRKAHSSPDSPGEESQKSAEKSNL